MPSTAALANKKQNQRTRQDQRRAELAAAGAPVGKKERSGTTGLAMIANQLLPREWEDVREIAERVGYLEALVASGSIQGSGMTLQLQVLPAYAHTALDLAQRTNQGVICLVAFQVPWQAFLPDDDPAQFRNPDADDEWATDDMGAL